MSLRRAGVPAARAAPCSPARARRLRRRLSRESAPDLLARAKTTLDDASSAHFVLEQRGRARRPARRWSAARATSPGPSSFDGTLKVRVLGSTLDLDVVSVDGTVYAQLPFASGFSVVDPAQFGFGDPGALLDPDTGISQLLGAGRAGAKLGEERRVGRRGRAGGDRARSPATWSSRSSPARTRARRCRPRFSIASDSGELRRAELTGPFFTAEEDATYTLELSDFGADVEITAPPTG